MEIRFDKEYLRDLYTRGDGGKKLRYQPHIVRKFINIVNLMIELPDVNSLLQYKSLNYEKLKGDKLGTSSVRVNDQYRIEFEEILDGEQTVANICNIV